MATMKKTEAFIRGRNDAQANRHPLFRSTRARGIVPTVDDAQADDWNDEMRADYIDGYNFATA